MPTVHYFADPPGPGNKFEIANGDEVPAGSKIDGFIRDDDGRKLDMNHPLSQRVSPTWYLSPGGGLSLSQVITTSAGKQQKHTYGVQLRKGLGFPMSLAVRGEVLGSEAFEFPGAQVNITVVLPEDNEVPEPAELADPSSPATVGHINALRNEMNAGFRALGELIEQTTVLTDDETLP